MFRVCVLFSGGKDSTLASFWAMFQGFDVVLLTIKSDEDSWMFHRPNVECAWMQAKAMELPHILVEGTKENELDIIKKTLDEMHFDYIEGGWPGSNPKDMDFFDLMKKEKLLMRLYPRVTDRQD